MSMPETVPPTPAVSWIDSVVEASRSVLPAPQSRHAVPVICGGFAVSASAAEGAEPDGAEGEPQAHKRVSRATGRVRCMARMIDGRIARGNPVRGEAASHVARARYAPIVGAGVGDACVAVRHFRVGRRGRRAPPSGPARASGGTAVQGARVS